jgi:hypothetical protein
MHILRCILLLILLFEIRQREQLWTHKKWHKHISEWHMAYLYSDNVTIKIFTAVSIKNTIVWAATPRTLAQVHWRPFQIMATFYRTAWLYIPEYCNDLYVYLQRDGRHFDLSIYLWLYCPLLDLGRFFSFLLLYTVGRTPWTRDQPVARPLPTHRTTQTQNKRTQTSMPCVGFEPTIPAFKRAKTVHALDREATMVSVTLITSYKLMYDFTVQN